MIRVMESPVLVITESNDQDIDRQLAKSIGAGSIVQHSRGTPIIDELWHGTIAPSELAKSERRKIVNREVIVKSEINNDLTNALNSLIKAEEIEDEEPEEKFKAKEDEDEKETEKSIDSELSFYIDLMKADEEDDSTMTDAEAEGAADREANKDDSEDEDDSEKSVGSALDDLIKAAGKQGEGSRGGKIIGHTRSGKPIYANANHPDHKGFTPKDHYDATKAHAKAQSDIRDYAQHMNGSTTMGSGADAQAFANMNPEQSKEHADHADAAKHHVDQIHKKGGSYDRLHMTGGMKSADSAKAAKVSASNNLSAHKNQDWSDHTAADHKKIADNHQSQALTNFRLGVASGGDLSEKYQKKAMAHSSVSDFHEKMKDSKTDFLSPGDQAEHDRVSAAKKRLAASDKSLPEGDLSKGTAMGVPEIKVDEYGIPLYEGNAFEVHDDADKNTVRELINAGLVGDPEHAMDKRIPQVINRVLGGVY